MIKDFIFNMHIQQICCAYIDIEFKFTITFMYFIVILLFTSTLMNSESGNLRTRIKTIRLGKLLSGSNGKNESSKSWANIYIYIYA